MRTACPLLLLLPLLLLALSPLPSQAHFLSWLIDWEHTCEPDFYVCPNGGVAFRDRKKLCLFTPCEYIQATPLPPPPPDPKTLPVTEWLHKHEFIVLAFDAAVLLTGQAVMQAWADALAAKATNRTASTYAGAVDMYVVPAPPSTNDSFERSAIANHIHTLAAVETTSTQPADLLVVPQRPWTQWQFFGRLVSAAFIPTVATVQAALAMAMAKDGSRSDDLEVNRLVLQATNDESITTTRLLAHCESILSASGVLAYDEEDASKHRNQSFARIASTNATLLVLASNTSANGWYNKPLPTSQWEITPVRCTPSMTAYLGTRLATSTDLHTIPPKDEEDPRVIDNENTTSSRAGEPTPRPPRCSCWRQSSLAGSTTTKSNTTGTNVYALCL